MAENLDDEMVASYAVAITGIDRTKAELARLDNAIRTLRSTQYGPGTTAMGARFGTSRADKMLKGKDDIFVAQIDQLEGRVQDGAQKAMASGMAYGRKAQAAALRAAETDYGRSGRKGKGPGREVSSALINGISTNVESQKTTAVTQILGWHGWRRGRQKYFEYQEKGTKGRPSGQQPTALNRKVKKRRPKAAAGRGVPAANSLGASIILVREHLKRELGKLKR